MITSYQIGNDLIKALGLPKMTRSFTLHCRAGEAVSVECEYYPESGDFVPVPARYHLVQRDETRPQPDTPSAEPIHFDTWMRDRTERAHREFMDRTTNLPRCDGRESLADKLKRYFGDREY